MAMIRFAILAIKVLLGAPSSIGSPLK